jgi:exopolysaccharide production protein ExoQ
LSPELAFPSTYLDSAPAHPASIQAPLRSAVHRYGLYFLIALLFVFFSAHASLSFFGDDQNTAISQKGGALLGIGSSESDTALGRTRNAVLWGIVGVMLVFRFRAIFRRLKDTKVFTALALLAIASAAWSQYPSISLRRGVFLFLSTLFAYYLVERFSPQEQMGLLVAAGVLAALGSIVAAVLFPQYGTDHMEHLGAWQGLFPHKNICASAMLLFLTPALYARWRGPIGQLARVAYIGLILFVLVMTQSRTGWIVGVLYVAVSMLLKLFGRIRRQDLVVAAIILVPLALLAAWQLSAQSNVAIGMLDRDITLSGRTHIWAALTTSLLKHPLLGYGYSAFWAGFRGESGNVALLLGWAVPHAHNGFLEVALELGLVGVGLVLISLLNASRHGMSCLKRDRPPYIDWYIGIIVLTCLYDVVEPAIVMDRQLIWMFYIVACAALCNSAKIIRYARANSGQ